LKFNLRTYWYAQIIGWGLFVLGNDITHIIAQTFVLELVFSSLLTFFCGIAVTHGFRQIVHKLGWNKLRVGALVPRVILSTLVMSMVYLFLYGALSDLLIPNTERILVFQSVMIIDMMNFAVVLLIWNLIYFAVHIFANFKASEIKNLELKAAKTEIELSSFKSQLNPHFMFNSMNSIRALVDENPTRAKEAITSLSAILRMSLTFGKKDLVPLHMELDLVKSYLKMEKIRFEERLRVEYDLQKEALETLIPPFTLQTIVENAVKHGVAKLKEGGSIHISVSSRGDKVEINVINSGELVLNGNVRGVGLNNTRERLELLFGDKASMSIKNDNGSVKATMNIPKKVSLK
jgi:LytS/YehU family sensor histidine kinase